MLDKLNDAVYNQSREEIIAGERKTKDRLSLSSHIILSPQNLSNLLWLIGVVTLIQYTDNIFTEDISFLPKEWRKLFDCQTLWRVASLISMK